MNLEHPDEVVRHLHAAVEDLSAAHRCAGEKDGKRKNLSGPVRDVLYGINSAVDALAQLIEEQA